MSDRIQPPVRMRYSFESRCRAVAAMLAGHSVGEVARGQGVGRATAYRWWVRFRTDGWTGLHDRRSTPHRQPRRLSPELEARILEARLDSGDGPQVLAAKLRLAASSVGKVLRRLGHSRRPRAPRPPVIRYERGRPGELLHLDTKKLGRFWHVASASIRTGGDATATPAGSTSTSRSTITRGSPTPRCSPPTVPLMPSPSSSVRWPGTESRA